MTKYKAVIYGGKDIGKVEIVGPFDSPAEARIEANRWCGDLFRHGARLIVEPLEVEETKCGNS